jgi:hypothetical protein
MSCMSDLVATGVVLAVSLGYGLAAWLVQMYRVAPPRDWLRERIWLLEAQIDADHWRIGDHGKRDLAKLSETISGCWLFLQVPAVQSG